MPTDDFSGLIGPEKFDSPVDDAFPPASYFGAAQFHAGLPRKMFPVLGGKAYQDDAGSCTAHGYSAPIEAWARKIGADFQVCRQDLYRGARWIEGNGAEKRDGGAFPSMVRRWLLEYGMVDESRKPYNAHEVTTWRPPAEWAADRALLTTKLDPIPLTADAVMAEIGSNGNIVAFCHKVTDAINRVNHTDGIEASDSGAVLGGHCRAVAGYDLEGHPATPLLLKNSWRRYGIAHPLFSTDTRFDDEPDSYSWMSIASFENAKFIMNVDRLAVMPRILP